MSSGKATPRRVRVESGIYKRPDGKLEIGSLTETMDAIQMAQRAGWTALVTRFLERDTDQSNTSLLPNTQK